MQPIRISPHAEL